MKSLAIKLVYVVLWLTFTHARVVFQGPCPDNIAVVDNFNIARYLGKWYEYAKYPIDFEIEGKCITAEYCLRKDGLVDVKNTLTNINTNAESYIIGNATLVENGKLLVKFPVPTIETDASNYWVLSTDYENYSVVYSCRQIKEREHETIVWILTRQALPEPKYIRAAVNVLKNENISLQELRITNQISCQTKCL